MAMGLDVLDQYLVFLRSPRALLKAINLIMAGRSPHWNPRRKKEAGLGSGDCDCCSLGWFVHLAINRWLAYLYTSLALFPMTL
ncbi:hypothetical protein GW17_00026264 [Ensete ventricosum]|nr:hypothetical protein GW17_00026264 [Ensete ventricosum]